MLDRPWVTTMDPVIVAVIVVLVTILIGVSAWVSNIRRSSLTPPAPSPRKVLSALSKPKIAGEIDRWEGGYQVVDGEDVKVLVGKVYGKKGWEDGDPIKVCGRMCVRVCWGGGGGGGEKSLPGPPHPLHGLLNPLPPPPLSLSSLLAFRRRAAPSNRSTRSNPKRYVATPV